MNDLGLTLAWLAVQVAILAGAGPGCTPWPRARAGRGCLGRDAEPRAGRGPERRGVPARHRTRRYGRGPACATASDRNAGAPHRWVAATTPVGRADPTAGDTPARRSGRGLGDPGWRLAWDRLGPRRGRAGGAGPALGEHPGGRSRWPGPAVGLLRLMIGLWAVALCRRRGVTGRRPGDDRACSRSCEVRMGCRRPVESARGARPDHARPRRAGAGRWSCCRTTGDRGATAESPRRARARAGSHRPRRLRRGPAGPARRGAQLLSSAGALDGRAAPAPAGAGGRRAGRTVRGRPDALPRGAVEPGLEAGRTVPVLAGEGVPPAAGDPDQEDRNVTG